MKITLKEFQEKFPKKNSVSEIKEILSFNKKEGYLFFREDIESLGLYTPFEFFYWQIPSSKSSTNAFPIPIVDFKLWKSKKELFIFLSRYLNRYYFDRTKEVNYLFQYDYEHPFIGRYFVWYFKNKNLRDHVL